MGIKKTIKKIIGKVVGKTYKYRLSYSKKIQKNNKSNFLSAYSACRVYKSYAKLFSNVELKNKSKKFFYSIDINKTFFYDGLIIGNLMLDYEFILNNSINDYEELIDKMNYDSKLYKKLKDLTKGINILIDREVEYTNNKEIKESLRGLKNRAANSFYDALQRILFINQLLWQTNHYLNGIGRLDYLLNDYYKNDIKSKKINKNKVENLIKDFLTVLHKDYYFKSNSLAGDTGQIIILGGNTPEGEYFYNDLTYIFINVVEQLKEPDPKLLLRVSEKTPRELISKSLKCVSTGIGCPLFANDDVIIPKLIDDGIKKEEAYNYGTAACWEPYIVGKSFDQCNMGSISFVEPLIQMLNKETLVNLKSFNKFINCYYSYLKEYLNNYRTYLDKLKYGYDPLLSMFMKDCIKNEKDISEGGAIYNNYGLTGVGLPNLVNSLLNIKSFVFDKKEYSLEELNTIRKKNYEGYEKLLKKLKNSNKRFGFDDKEIIDLTNQVIRKVTEFFKGKKNPLGGQYKFGLSAPSYISLSRNIEAAFDGRKNNEPFAVHISSDKSNGYTELVSFASELDYGENRYNGNVIDFFVTPNFIEDNFEKFTDFIMFSIKRGFFELQMNVVSSEQLIAAKKNPEKYKKLVVRVWGFSAYFNDLPDNYKDYLIERALKNEGKN